MNKNTIIGIALMVVLFVGFGIYQVNVSEKQAEQQAKYEQAQEAKRAAEEAKNAEIKAREFPGEVYWIDIVYPELNATIHCSYKPVRNNLRDLSRDSQEFLFSHSRVATAIPAQEFANPSEKVYGVCYDLQGNTASPIQFILTDSTRHFFRGSVYCNAIPNQDSLAPIYDYIREDVRVLIESMKWQ
jgi:gliding motility-associated lipoprotein GldD